MKSFFRRLFGKPTIDDDINEELQFHLDMRARLIEGEGARPDDAERRARRQFGEIMRIHEDIRRIHISAFVETLGQDLRYAVRSFLRTPVLTAAAILAIALGIGSTTAVFSVVDLILFRSLPFANDDRLVSVGMTAPILPGDFLLGTDYLEWRRSQTPFEAFTSWNGVSDCDLSEQNPLRLSCAAVESTFLPTFGVQPLLGRNFTVDEDKPKAPRVALLSYSLWQSRFAGNPKVLEDTIPIDGQQTRVIGVLPSTFELPTLAHPDIVIPQALPEEAQVRPNAGRPLTSFARLKPGVTVAQAQAALGPLFQESMKWIPTGFARDVHLRVRSLRDYQVQDARLASWTLLGSVLAVLLIACANVANLLLARSASRQGEFAVRSAIGAGRGRLIRQSLTESLLLSVAGGVVGVIGAYGLLHAFIRFAPSGIPRLPQAQLDARVLLFALIASSLAGLIFGLIPAMQLPKPETLVGWRVAGNRRRWLRPCLVAGQIAISLVLLTAATLLIRTLWNMEQVPLGFRAGNIVMASVALSAQQYATIERQNGFFEELESKVADGAGFNSVALADTTPPAPAALLRLLANIEVAGQQRTTEGTGGSVGERSITPGYFATLGIPILQGRVFEEADRIKADSGVVLSESLARLLLPHRDAVNQRVRLSPESRWLTVIGVVGDVKNTALTEQTMPEVYAVRRRGAETSPGIQRHATLIVRSSLRTDVVAAEVRNAIATIDGTLPVTISTMQERADHLTERPRFNAALLSLFGVIGLLLASIGLYGVMASLVVQRTQEIGVRMAIGATKRDIVRLVLGQAARWTIAGVVLGVAGSWLATRFLRQLLFNVPEHDPVAFGSSVLFLVVVIFFAAVLPSMRAASVDPVTALRSE